MNAEQLPTEIWLQILDEAIHVPHLMEIEPPASYAFAITPDDFSIDRLHSSVHARTSFSRVSKWFKTLIASFGPQECLLVTNRNAPILHRAFLAFDDLVLSTPRKGRARHPLFLTTRHLIVDIYPEADTHANKTLHKALKSIVYHLPNIRIFTANFASNIDTGPYDMSALMSALSSSCAPKLRKIAFCGGAYARLFLPDDVYYLLRRCTSLQTLVIRAPRSTCKRKRYPAYPSHFRLQPEAWPPCVVLDDSFVRAAVFDQNPPTNFQSRRLAVSPDSTFHGFRDILYRPIGTTTALTHLSVKLWALPPTDFPPFEIQPEIHPRLSHLILEGMASQLSSVLQDGMQRFPGVRHLALAVEDGASCTVTGMVALLQRVVALTGSTLVSVRFAGEGFAECLRRIGEREGVERLGEAVERLDSCTFVVEDWAGRRFLDSFGWV